MQQNQLPLPDESTQLTELPPLTPEERERSQAIVERVLADVFGEKDSEPGQ